MFERWKNMLTAAKLSWELYPVCGSTVLVSLLLHCPLSGNATAAAVSEISPHKGYSLLCWIGCCGNQTRWPECFDINWRETKYETTLGWMYKWFLSCCMAHLDYLLGLSILSEKFCILYKINWCTVHNKLFILYSMSWTVCMCTTAHKVCFFLA